MKKLIEIADPKEMEKFVKSSNCLLVDDEYVYSRKNAFYNHIKNTNESPNLKASTIPSK